MADTELVIKIPDRIYYGIEKGITVNGSMASQIVLDAVKNGTPLPKGHSDLIDRDELLDTVPELNAFEEEEFDTEWMVKLVHAASPIIKADKE